MAFELRITLSPDIPGGFRPTTFDHLLQHRIELPGLDRQHVHTLIHADVAADGNAAELTIHSEPIAPLSLDQGIRFVNGTPHARVKAVTPDGEELAAVQLMAPLRKGQRVAIGESEYVVADTGWPLRHPRTGVCSGEIDWQHATLIPVDPGSPTPQIVA